MPSLFKSLAILVLATTTATASFDTHQGAAHANRGLVHRHRQHQRAPEASTVVGIVARAGAAYNETDHDSTASIEIGGGQPSTTVTSVSVGSSAPASSSVVSVTSSAAGVSSGVSSAGVSSPTSAVPSVTSTSSVVPTAVVTSSSSSSSSISSTTAPSSIASSSPSSTPPTSESSSTDPLSSATPTTTASSVSQIISTVRSTVTDSADPLSPTSPTSTNRGAKTGSVSIKTASVSSTASAAAAAGSGGTTSGMSGGTRTAVIVVCVVGGIALGAFALWTIIRRWKLRPSRRFDGRMEPLDFSPTSPDAFYEKTHRRHSGNSTSSADRQRRQFVDELDNDEVYDHHVHAQQYDMTGMEGGAALSGVPSSHDFTAAAGVASSSYPQHHREDYAEDEGYADLRRGPSLTHPSTTTTFAGVGAGGAGLPGAGYQHHQTPEMYRDDTSDGYHRAASPQGLAREPSLGRPTRGEGPYAAATHFAGSGPRY